MVLSRPNRAHLATFANDQTLGVDRAEAQVQVHVPIDGRVTADSQDQQQHGGMRYIAT
jgi:hypothetical protein